MERVSGFLEGQAVAYCERVSKGCSSAAQLVCPAENLECVLRIVEQEECKAYVSQHEHGRVSIWIYREDQVGGLIEAAQSGIQTDQLRCWTMGKLLGYSDHEVIRFIEASYGTVQPPNRA